MPFAVKLQKNESITLSSALPLNLILTSITLDPSSKKANLYIRSKQDQSLVLITMLERQKTQSYSCTVQLFLGEETQELIVKEGDIHIIANVQSIGQEVSRISPSSIKIARKDHRAEGQHCKSEKNKKNEINAEEKTSKKTEKTAPKIPQGKFPKKLNLLEMMNNIADDEDDDSDDCFQAEEESESDSSSSENEEQEKASKMKKKISWAAMLHDVNDSDDEEYSKHSESSEKSVASEDEQLKDKTKKKIKVDQVQPKREERGEDRKEEHLKKVANKPKIIVKSDSESSSSFEFQVPKGLPSFVGKK